MKHVAPVRKKLGVPTIFNILGPLINPAGASRQLLGVGRAELRPLLAEALVLLGTARSVVVHGSDGLDEVTLTGSTEVAEAAGQVRHFQWTPADFGLGTIDLTEHPGQPGPTRVPQPFAGCWPASRDRPATSSWPTRPPPCGRPARPRRLLRAASLAAEAIDTAAASDLLARLVARSHGR